MKKVIIFLFLMSGFLAQAQNYLDKADKKYRNKDFDEAIGLYYQAYLENQNNYRILKGLVLSNQQLGKTVEAENWMQKIVEQNKHSTSDILLYSELLLANDKYSEAQKWFAEFAQLNPYDNKTKDGKAYYEWLNKLKSTSSFALNPISLNTAESDIGASFFENGIVFSSAGFEKNRSTGNKTNLDLFFSPMVDEVTFGNPVHFAEKINTSYNDGPLSFDKTTGFLYVNRYAPQKAEFDEGELFYHMQIVVAKQKNGIWQFDHNFFFNSPNYTVCHPNISSDGKVMLFSSDINGGYGGADIYFCYKDSTGNWSKPINIGGHVNTSGNEFFPFLGNDNTLYFSSDGHKGIGGYDIFRATPENGIFKNIKNLGFGINSAKDEVAFLIDSTGMAGYVSSNRAGGKGLYDIYYFKNQQINIFISGEVKDLDSKRVVAGILVEIRNENGETIHQANTSSDGKFRFEAVKKNVLNFYVQGNDYEPLENKLNLEPIKNGEELILEVFVRKNSQQ